MFTTKETDQMLWEGIRRGDERAFTRAFDRYHATLYNYGCKLSADTALVEDAIQDVFSDIWRLRFTLTEQISSIKFYLYRSLRRRIHTSLSRHPRTEDLSALPDGDLPFIPNNSETSITDFESKAMQTQRLGALLDCLPQRQIEAITLRYFDEFSFEDTARIMGVSEKSVRNFIYKALVFLRQNRKKILPISLLLLPFLSV